MPDRGHEIAADFHSYPKPSLAVDPVVMTVHDGELWTALWRRQDPPYAGQWALPGVFVNLGESFAAAVARALKTKLGIESTREPVQLNALNRVDRDPRGWVVTIAYYVLVPYEQLAADLEHQPEAELFRVHPKSRDSPGGRGPHDVTAADGEPVTLSFDHDEIIDLVVRRIQDLIWADTIIYSVLPDRFTLRQAQTVFEAILGFRLNKDSFRRRITRSLETVEATGEIEQGVDHRPAELYRVAERSRIG